MCFAQAGTVCSLSGFAPLHPYANPLLVSKVAQKRTLKGILPCTAQPFRLCLQEKLLNGQCPGERTDRAGLCKAHKARLCELERNPRQPTTNPLPQAEKSNQSQSTMAYEANVLNTRSPSYRPKTKNV